MDNHKHTTSCASDGEDQYHSRHWNQAWSEGFYYIRQPPGKIEEREERTSFVETVNRVEYPSTNVSEEADVDVRRGR